MNQFCKGAQRWARFDFTGRVFRLESCVPLIDLSEQKVQGQPWPTCRTLISHLFSIRGGTSTTWEAFRGLVPASLPSAGCPARWGGVRWVKPLLGKLPWEWGGTSHCSCRAVWGCWLENSGSGSQDVVGTGKTLGCFIHLSGEVATTDLWA